MAYKMACLDNHIKVHCMFSFTVNLKHIFYIVLYQLEVLNSTENPMKK